MRGDACRGFGKIRCQDGRRAQEQRVSAVPAVHIIEQSKLHFVGRFVAQQEAIGVGGKATEATAGRRVFSQIVANPYREVIKGAYFRRPSCQIVDDAARIVLALGEGAKRARRDQQ